MEGPAGWVPDFEGGHLGVEPGLSRHVDHPRIDIDPEHL